MRHYRAFVSMPFGDKPTATENPWFRLYEYGIKPCAELLASDTASPMRPDAGENPGLVFTRADREVKSLRLKENVSNHIDSADFVLSVLASSTADRGLISPNVLWEIGYAEAKGMPIIFVGTHDVLAKLPVLVGADHLHYPIDFEPFAPDKDISEAKRAGLRVARDLLPYVLAAISMLERWRPGRRGRYDVQVSANGQSLDLRNVLESARSTIDILTTNLEDFCTHFTKISPDGVGDILERAVRKGVRVRIVSLNPDSHIAEYRAQQLSSGRYVATYRESLRTAVCRFHKRLHEYYGSRFSLKLYDDLPLQTTMRVDNNVVIAFAGKLRWGPVLAEFRVEDEGVVDTFVEHFSSVFESAVDVRKFSWLAEDDK